MRRVIVVGAGALGSHLALALRNADCQLMLIDHDRVLAKNVKAQFHTKMGIGKSKVNALKAAFQGMFNVKLDVAPFKIVEVNVEALLKGADLVIDCTDNIQARSTIQGHCVDTQTDCLHCCLSGDGYFARFVWTEHFDADAEPELGQETCEDGEGLPFYIQAAALAAQVTQLYLKKEIKQCWQATPFSVVRLA